MPYCTIEEVTEILSEEGVAYRVDDNENGNVNTKDLARVQAAIDTASMRIDFWMARKYISATLQSSRFISFCCIWIASRYLCRRRGGAVPDSISETASEMEDMLRLIYDGQAVIPDVSPDTHSGITSIVVGTMRMGHSQPFRKNPYQSTPKNKVGHNRWLDYRSQHWE